jgi:hypothetical protein
MFPLVGDFIFVHAGILLKHIDKISGNFITKINNSMRQYLNTGRIDTNIKNILFSDSDSLLWTRKYNNPNICNSIDDVKNFFKVKSIIVGHSVQENISPICNNSIWRVDVGLSKSMGSTKIQVLEILDNGESLQKNNYKPYRVIDL